MSCSVEYALSQLKPRKQIPTSGPQKNRNEPLPGTIEEDEHFKAFLAELTAPAHTPAPETDVPLSRGLTPLLAAIKAKDQKKFELKVARKSRKRGGAKKSAGANHVTSKSPKTAGAVKKRKRPKKKKKIEASGPQFGAVKILGANIGDTSPASASAATVTSATPSETKKRKYRKPKIKKTGDSAHQGQKPKRSANT